MKHFIHRQEVNDDDVYIVRAQDKPSRWHIVRVVASSNPWARRYRMMGTGDETVAMSGVAVKEAMRNGGVFYT